MHYQSALKFSKLVHYGYLQATEWLKYTSSQSKMVDSANTKNGHYNSAADCLILLKCEIMNPWRQ